MLKNITLSAEDELIRKTREGAQQERTTLNALFRVWPDQYVSAGRNLADYDALMKSLSYANPCGSFTRDELNKRNKNSR